MKSTCCNEKTININDHQVECFRCGTIEEIVWYYLLDEKDFKIWYDDIEEATKAAEYQVIRFGLKLKLYRHENEFIKEFSKENVTYDFKKFNKDKK